jgi:hypothetical protein
VVQSVFGAGYLFSLPSGAKATPVMFGAVQDTSVDFSFDLKALYGQMRTGVWVVRPASAAPARYNPPPQSYSVRSCSSVQTRTPAPACESTIGDTTPGAPTVTRLNKPAT